MKCSELQLNLTLDLDETLGGQGSIVVRNHLVTCPLCRQKAAEYRDIRSQLRGMRRPGMSIAMQNSLRASVRYEIHSRKRRLLPVTNDVREWLQMRLMPYCVGVFASIMVAAAFLTMMFSGMLHRTPAAGEAGDSTVLLASNSNPYSSYDPTVIMAADYAHSRLAFSAESPSVNPQGALIALTKSLMRGEMKDEEVVVVAQVFSNGLAKVTEVVEPSQDRNVIRELKKALQSDAAYSPFVPAVMENRPENMVVILKFQSVNVNTGNNKR